MNRDMDLYLLDAHGQSNDRTCSSTVLRVGGYTDITL